jgi:hypothetical protein
MGAPVLIEGQAEGLVLLQEDITERRNHQARWNAWPPPII